MDAALEQKVKTCQACQGIRKNPAPAPLHPWEWPQQSWSRVHADYAGPFMGHNFLLLVDAHTKWIEVLIVSAATSQATIEMMRKTFATLGLPEMLVTDNGSVFTSSEFIKRNGICHVNSSPYHPASNGLAERAVQTLKDGLKKMASGSLETKLARFLFQYRLTPQSVTGVSPSELMFSRRLRSQLDLLRLDIQTRVEARQEQQRSDHDRHARSREFRVGDFVNFNQGPMWVPGVVVLVRGPVSYTVELANGKQERKHVDHLRELSLFKSRFPSGLTAVDLQPPAQATERPGGNEGNSISLPPRLSSRIR